MTGNSLESFILSINSDILCGENNYLGIVKNKRIRQSAAKNLINFIRLKFTDYPEGEYIYIMLKILYIMEMVGIFLLSLYIINK